MPYVTRDPEKNVQRVSLQAVPGSEMVSYDHPDLMAFLVKQGQDPLRVQNTIDELRRTDVEMARAVEDVIMALLKKNILKMTDLPKVVQDRMGLRVKLRMTIQDIFDQASGQKSMPSAQPPTFFY